MSQGSPAAAADGHDPDQADAGGQQPDIAWVGQQWRMDGYCGRATPAETPVPAATSDEGVRPIAVVRTRPSQGRVVRIGPPRESNPAPAA